eukprot:7253732-Heterocapsa_arctica.AAC.1
MERGYIYDDRELQTTIADQQKALDKLTKFYDAEDVMQMIEKLIQDARQIQADSKKSEADAQAAYKATIANTSASVQAHQESVVSKAKAMNKAKKEHRNNESDLGDTMKELEGLVKTGTDLHA